SPAYIAITAIADDRLRLSLQTALDESLRELTAERSKISTLLRHLESGKNVLGLGPGFVEFIFNRERDDPRFNNFIQVRLQAEDKLNRAQAPCDEFRRQAREFETSVRTYQDRVQSHLESSRTQVSTLCGSPDATLDRCTGGKLGEARND